jgi:putative salt-induced outer membrane protein
MFIAGPTWGQGNPPGTSAGDPIEGQIALGYLATSGNTESTSANATFGLLYHRTRWVHEFDAAAAAATTEDVTTAEAYSLKYESRRPFGEEEASYFFTSVDWREDRFSAFEREVSEAVGYGRRFVERGPHVLNAEVGVGARQAYLVDGTEQDEGIVRSALDYTLSMSDTTSFAQDLVIESGGSNTSVESISALRARVIGNIGLVVSYRVKTNSAVPINTESTDRYMSLALEYAF